MVKKDALNVADICNMKLEFTRPEIIAIKEKIYLTDLQTKILDYKLEGT